MVSSDDGQSLLDIPAECLKGSVCCSLSGHADELNPGPKVLAACPERLTEPAAGPVPLNRTAHLAAHREPNLERAIPTPPEHEQRRPLHAFAALEDSLKLSSPPERFAPENPASSRPPGHANSARRRGAYALLPGAA